MELMVAFPSLKQRLNISQSPIDIKVPIHFMSHRSPGTVCRELLAQFQRERSHQIPGLGFPLFLSAFLEMLLGLVMALGKLRLW